MTAVVLAAITIKCKEVVYLQEDELVVEEIVVAQGNAVNLEDETLKVVVVMVGMAKGRNDN
ncbi:hypothetical protein LOAG_03743 [Loa loa]|uniref:Uncharacterized protein n=1 Tax=Loa loa TaxID=7209 RepID=A0A1S0U5H2_LOALO|nr:hypothetical protein LOAG_03743 [Loa loa]EFO24739.2 hypothetical protein LOAG_03743 [Loa loa]